MRASSERQSFDELSLLEIQWQSHDAIVSLSCPPPRLILLAAASPAVDVVERKEEE